MGWKLMSHNILHTNVYRSFICNCPSLEATKICFNRSMEKQTEVIYIMEYYAVLQRNELSSHKKTWWSLDVHYYVKEARVKGTYCMIPTKWQSGKGKTIQTVKGSMVTKVSVVVKYKGFAGWWNYSVWYSNGYSKYAFVKTLQYCEYKGWTLM